MLEGSKKSKKVQKGLGRFKNVHGGSRWFKKGSLKKVLVQEGSRQFKKVQEVSSRSKRVPTVSRSLGRF